MDWVGWVSWLSGRHAVSFDRVGERETDGSTERRNRDCGQRVDPPDFTIGGKGGGGARTGQSTSQLVITCAVCSENHILLYY